MTYHHSISWRILTPAIAYHDQDWNIVVCLYVNSNTEKQEKEEEEQQGSGQRLRRKTFDANSGKHLLPVFRNIPLGLNLNELFPPWILHKWLTHKNCCAKKNF